MPIAALAAMGIRMFTARPEVASARGWGDEAVYYADPDGNVLVLARPPATAPARR